METGVPDYRAEPLLNLGRQAKKARQVPLLREPDDHPGSLADKMTVAWSGTRWRNARVSAEGRGWRASVKFIRLPISAAGTVHPLGPA
jgi:hypothetical protein